MIKRSLRRYVREHPRIAWMGGIAAVAALIFVLAWFQPQKLFLEQTVDEASPLVEPTETDGPVRPVDRTERSSVFAEGSFQGLEHPTTGTAKILKLSDGRRFLRLEDLDTSNGPDLRVYLSEIPASDDWRAYGERFLDLGALKGNRGDQNYEIPQGIDLSGYKSAVIWCRRFTVGFGVAGFS